MALMQVVMQTSCEQISLDCTLVAPLTPASDCSPAFSVMAMARCYAGVGLAAAVFCMLLILWCNTFKL
jgi:hypothetical protein